MFKITNEALIIAALQKSFNQPGIGAYVSFEGWVRNHNDGKTVLGLEYEAYTDLAVKEGNRIVKEAQDKFDCYQLKCVHRIGNLAIGDIAVWVGAVSAHRDDAFKACKYLIDEVKLRVPIWKKETYQDGNTTWVACEQCGHPTPD